MTTIWWLVLFAIAAAFGWFIRHNLRKWRERQRAEEERFANFMKASAGATQLKDPPALPALLTSAAVPAAAPPATVPGAALQAGGLAQQKMLFEAAHKAGEAGEPALAIQLYGRLLARYPATAFANPVREAMEAQKKRLLTER